MAEEIKPICYVKGVGMVYMNRMKISLLTVILRVCSFIIYRGFVPRVDTKNGCVDSSDPAVKELLLGDTVLCIMKGHRRIANHVCSVVVNM